MNAATAITLLGLYAVEVLREHYLITNLDIDHSEPDDNLKEAMDENYFPVGVREGIARNNLRYRRVAIVGLSMAVANLLASAVFLFWHYNSSQTVFTYFAL